MCSGGAAARAHGVSVGQEGTVYCVDRSHRCSGGDQTGDQTRSGDLVRASSHTKDGHLAEPESQRTDSTTMLPF